MPSPKVLFLHGRPVPHPFHEALARSVDADFLPIDFLLRWHDRDAGRLYRYLSSIVCGVFLPRRKYDIIVSEGPYIAPVVTKAFWLLRRHQKIATLLPGETLPFMKSGYYSARTTAKITKILSWYDSLICSGPLITKLAHEYVPSGSIISTINTGVSKPRREALQNITPDLSSKRLLYISNGPSGFRAWYKGIELVLETMALVAEARPELELCIVGWWDLDFRQSLMAKFPTLANRVFFTEIAKDLAVYASYLASSCLCLHLARGDACPISVLEAMAGGLPVIQSDFTGTYEAGEQVDPSLVVPLDARLAANRVLAYLDSPLEEKRALSERSRQVALSQYTQERSIDEFKAALAKLAPSANAFSPGSSELNH